MLNEIIAHKKARLEEIDMTSAVRKLEAIINNNNLPPVISLKENLQGQDDISIIAEIKRKSPSKGTLNPNIRIRETAALYERAGVKGISVLTEDKYFCGDNDDIAEVKKVTDLPVLRKDFIIHEYQVLESRVIGADAILLIAKVLPSKELIRLASLARQLKLETVFEIHDLMELDRVLETEPDIIGINNRDLTTFKTDLRTFEFLIQFIPTNIVSICESGIFNRNDIEFIRECGAEAVLVGESIVTSPDPYAKICELRGLAL